MSKAAVLDSTEQHTEGGHDSQPGLERALTGPARLIAFLKETRSEMHKVVTPTRAEVQATTIVVVITVFMFAAYFSLVDAVVGRGIDQLFVYMTKH
jgi:preprotein translocase subunit SecE